MESIGIDWVLLWGTWTHIFFAMGWAALSLSLFIFADKAYRPYKLDKDQAGTLSIIKKTLKWYRISSHGLWLSGIILLIAVFYIGKGARLLDESVSNISFKRATLVNILLAVLIWPLYDFIDKLCGKRTYLSGSLYLLGSLGAAYYFFSFLSVRASYLHLGALAGICMLGNALFRIYPFSRPEVVGGRSWQNFYMGLFLVMMVSSSHSLGLLNHLNHLVIFFLLASTCVIIGFSFYRKKWQFLLLTGVTIGALFFISFSSNEYKKGHYILRGSSAVSGPVVAKQLEKSGVRRVKGPKGAPGTVRGRVRLKGIIPSQVPLKLPAVCAKLYPLGKILDNKIVLTGRNVKNVLVSIIGPIPKGDFLIPHLKKNIAQKGCLFVPRMSAALVGQEIVFVNNDPIAHEITLLAKKNSTFDIGRPQRGMAKAKKFKHAEKGIIIKNKRFPWMHGNLTIFDHPFFSVTNGAGEFFINQVPPGEYLVEAWHEVLGKSQKRIILAKGEQVVIDFEL